MSANMPKSETRKGAYTMTVLKTTVEVDELGLEVVVGGAPCVEVVDVVGVTGPALEVVDVVVTGGGASEVVVVGGTSEVVGGWEVVGGCSLVEGGWVAAGERASAVSRGSEKRWKKMT